MKKEVLSSVSLSVLYQCRTEVNAPVVRKLLFCVPFLQVSLDSHVRDVINRNMLEPTSHTFEEAQQQIYTLMQRDSYPRFINSATYTDLLKSLEEPRPEP